MSSAGADIPEDDYIEGGSIAWDSVAKGVVGVVLGVAGYAIAAWIGLIRTGVNAVLSGIGSWYGKLVSTPFEAGREEILQSYEAAESGIRELGILAYPVAVGISILAMSLMLWGVSRYVR